VEEVPGPYIHAKFHRCGFKFAPQGKIGLIGKVEYRCTTTNLPLCNDTINVLKITLLRCHSVSVITNFVIPKRDKNRQPKKTSHVFVYSRRATHDLHHIWHGDRADPYHFGTPNFFYPISSFAARGYWKFVELPNREKMFITRLIVSRSDQIKHFKATYRRHTKIIFFDATWKL